MRSLKIFLMITVLLATIYGIALIIYPAELLAVYGIELSNGGELISRIVGVYLLGYAFINWNLRNSTDKKLINSIIIADLFTDAAATIISVYGVYMGIMNAMGWEMVVINLALTLGFTYFLIETPWDDVDRIESLVETI